MTIQLKGARLTATQVDGGNSQSTFTIDPTVATVGSPASEGDYVVVILTNGGITTTNPIVPPSGWDTLHAFSAFGTTGAGTGYFGAYGHFVQAGESVYHFGQTPKSGANSNYAQTLWFSGVDESVSPVVGATGTRNGTSSTVATAPSITTLTDDSYCICIAADRTVAAETLAQITANNGFTQLAGQLISDAASTVVVFGKQTEAEGAVGATTVTWPNPHAWNAAALLLGFATYVAPPATFPVKVSDGTDYRDGELYISDGTQLLVPTKVLKVKPGYESVDAMLADTHNIFVAHRGGSYSYPEHSAFAYGQSAMKAWPALEMSIGRSSDGVFFGLHDESLDRTSLGTTGNTLVASAMTWAQIQQYEILGSTADYNPTQPNRPYCGLQDLFDAYAKSHVLFLDAKLFASNSSYVDSLLDLMDANGGTDRFVAKYYGVGSSQWITRARARGYKTWGYFYAADSASYAQYADAYDILGLNYDAAQTYWDQLRAVLTRDQRILAHICPNSAAVSTGTSKGATGAMVSGTETVIPF